MLQKITEDIERQVDEHNNANAEYYVDEEHKELETIKMRLNL